MIIEIFTVISIVVRVHVMAVIQDTISIGGIFHESSEVYTAFQFAVKMANKRKTIPYRIETRVDFTDVSSSYNLAEHMCAQLARGVFALFGVSNASSSHVQQSISQRLHIPYITPGVKSPLRGLASNEYTISMRPELITPLNKMIRFYNWNEIYYVYDTDDGLFRLQGIYEEFMGSRYRMQVFVWRVTNVFRCHDTLRHLDRSSDGPKRIVVDLSSIAAYKAFLRQIVQVGMNRDKYHYLLGTLAMTELNFTPFLYGGVNITGFSLPKMLPEKRQRFMSSWNLYSRDWPGWRRNRISTESILMIDGVTAFINAISKLKPKDFKKVFRRGHIYNNDTAGVLCNDTPSKPWVLGKRIEEEIFKNDFEGLSGDVLFFHGRRSRVKLDVWEMGYMQPLRKIGTWSPDQRIEANVSFNHIDSTEDTSSQNRTLIITTIATPPYVIVREKSDDGKVPVGNDRYEGYCIELAALLAKKVLFEYRIKLVSDNEFGSLKGGKWTGMIGELSRKEADLAIAPLSITQLRERAVDFTKPFMRTGISIMIKKPEPQKAGVFSFMDPLDRWVWLCIVIGFLCVSVVLFFVGRFSPYEWRVSDQKVAHNDEGEEKLYTKSSLTNQFSLYNTLWFSLGAIMQQGSDISPRSLSGRIVGSGWWFFTLFIISSYTANLAAFLTIEKILTPIKSADDLLRQNKIKYGIVNSGSSKEFFTNTDISIYNEMGTQMEEWGDEVYVSKIIDGVDKVRKSKGKYAFLLESAMNDYHNQRQPCNTIKVGPNLDSKGYGVGTPLGSKIRERLNVAVLELAERGELFKLEQKWWLDKGECGHDGSKDTKQGALILSNVSGIFHILIGGLGLSMLSALIEYIYNSTISKKSKKAKALKERQRLASIPSYDPPPYSEDEHSRNYSDFPTERRSDPDSDRSFGHGRPSAVGSRHGGTAPARYPHRQAVRTGRLAQRHGGHSNV